MPEDVAPPRVVPRAPDIFPGDALESTTAVGHGVTGAVGAPQGWRVLAVLSALMGFSSISTDLYLPAMPVIGHELHAAAGTIEFTVTGYLIGFTVGQLFWGPISDRFGRRRPIAVGLVLFVLGSACCALADSASTLIAARILQAMGASASVVLARAIVRDLYAGRRAAQMLSSLMTVMGIAPLLGPFVGGQILTHAGWRTIFSSLCAVGLVTLVALWTLPETLPVADRSRAPLGGVLHRYADLLTDRRILGYAGAGGFFYGGMFAYIAGTPFAYITYYHVPAALYGLLFGLGIAGIMIINVVNVRLVMRFGSQHLLLAGTWMAAIAGVVLGVAAKTGTGGLWGLVVPLFIFMSANGFITANSIAGALIDYPREAGAVSALVGAVHYGCGIIGSALVGTMADGTPWPMGIVIAVAGIGCLMCARLSAVSTRERSA